MKLLIKKDGGLELHFDQHEVDAQIEVLKLITCTDQKSQQEIDNHLTFLQLTRAGYPKHLQ